MGLEVAPYFTVFSMNTLAKSKTSTIAIAIQKIHEDNSKDVQLSEQERGAPWNQHALKFRLS